MIPHALRRASTLFLATCAAVFTLVMVAGPALATEGGEATSEASGFGTGQWDGMLLAGIGGVLLGLLVFALSSPGEIHRDAH